MSASPQRRDIAWAVAGIEDLKLHIGTRLQFSMPNRLGDTGGHSTTLIGYEPGAYLLVKTPFEKGLPLQFQAGEKIGLQAFSGTRIFGFNAEIERVVRAPYHYLHLGFPREIRTVQLRRVPRVRTELEIEVAGGAGAAAKARLVDLSVDGAKLLTRGPLGAPGTKVELRFAFSPDGCKETVPVTVTATVRRAHPKPDAAAQDRWSHGVAFAQLSAVTHALVQSYVYQVALSDWHRLM